MRDLGRLDSRETGRLPDDDRGLVDKCRRHIEEFLDDKYIVYTHLASTCHRHHSNDRRQGDTGLMMQTATVLTHLQARQLSRQLTVATATDNCYENC